MTEGTVETTVSNGDPMRETLALQCTRLAWGNDPEECVSETEGSRTA